MNRAQRAAHQRLWWVLTPLLLALLALAILRDRGYPDQPPPLAAPAGR